LQNAINLAERKPDLRDRSMANAGKKPRIGKKGSKFESGANSANHTIDMTNP
jgi:hypothetical protein